MRKTSEKSGAIAVRRPTKQKKRRIRSDTRAVRRPTKQEKATTVGGNDV